VPETGRPGLGAQENPPPQRAEKPAAGDAGGEASTEAEKQRLNSLLDKEIEKQRQNQSQLEAPKLISPNDRQVQRSPAPVRTAVYLRPAGVSRDQVITQPITWEKARRDAVGWTSASK
jgi:hypothetical protein